MNQRILIVDDEPDIRQTLGEILEDEGYAVDTAGNGAQARERFQRHPPDLVLLDIWMPDIDGITLLREWQRQRHLPIVVMSGHGTVETAVEATRLGAFDYLEKPLSMTRLLATLERALGVPPQQAPPPPATPLVSRSPAMNQLQQRLLRLAPQPYGITLWGPPGSAKRVLARLIHRHSPRNHGPYTVLDAEAPGAAWQRLDDHGTWQEWAGGSLALLHLERLPLALQQRLLARLDGGPRPRLIATARQPPSRLLREGRLLDGLYSHLSEVELRVPSLEERREDIPDLAQQLLERLVAEEGLPYRPLSIAALNHLRHAPWPGGLIELRALLRRLLLEGRGEVSGDEVAQRPPPATPAPQPLPADLLELPLREARERFERRYLEAQLKRVNGNVSELARRSGLERTHLHRKLRGLGIDPRRIKKKRQPAEERAPSGEGEGR